MFSNIGTYPTRNSDSYKAFLLQAFGIYCKYVKIEKPSMMSPSEKAVLRNCHERSLHPIIPAIHFLKASYPGQSHYERFPADLMHTRILEEWVSHVVTIVKLIETLQGPFNIPHAQSKLEEKIQMFPRLQAMPFSMKQFKDPLEGYCPSGTLKMIDSKDVPSLMLQILISTPS